MSELPDKFWVRRGEAIAYLGISDQAFTKLVQSGALKEKFLPGTKRAYFERTEVVKFKPAEKEQEP